MLNTTKLSNTPTLEGGADLKADTIMPRKTTKTQSPSDEHLIRSLLDCQTLTSWERSFIQAVAATKQRSKKQIEKLEAIAARRLGGEV